MCFRPSSLDVKKKCPSCGSLNPSKNDTCEKCGFELPASAAPAAHGVPGAAGAPKAPGAPGAPAAPGAPGVPKPPTA